MFDQASLDQLFNEVKVAFFPQWDRKNRWRAEFDSGTRRREHTGYCDSKASRVYLDPRQFVYFSPEGKVAFLIHEICHDIAAASHNREWAVRMLKAATCAEESGEAPVAEAIRDQVFACGFPGKTVEYNRYSVEAFVDGEIEKSPSILYEELTAIAAKYFGHSTTKLRREHGPMIRSRMRNAKEI